MRYPLKNIHLIFAEQFIIQHEKQFNMKSITIFFNGCGFINRATEPQNELDSGVKTWMPHLRVENGPM